MHESLCNVYPLAWVFLDDACHFLPVCCLQFRSWTVGFYCKLTPRLRLERYRPSCSVIRCSIVKVRYEYDDELYTRTANCVLLFDFTYSRLLWRYVCYYHRQKHAGLITSILRCAFDRPYHLLFRDVNRSSRRQSRLEAP